MRYVSFEYPEGKARSWGLLLDNKVLDLPRAGDELRVHRPASLLEFIREGRTSWPWASEVLAAAQAGRFTGAIQGREGIRLLAPIPRPPKNVFALGLNYADHVLEAGAAVPLPDVPIYFTKAATAVIGPNEPVVADPRVTTNLDWEIELGVVMSGGGRWIPRETALEHVFGYTIITDMSARDLQHGRPAGQWFLGKSADGFCPMGPVLVSANEIPAPQSLEIALRVNGVEKQRSNTRHMIFDVAAIIADLSRYVTLEPGDVISTGTPRGVGDARTPPEFLRPGDVVEAEIESIGVLRTPIIGVEE
jgi:2-keto-4-pentenoate hydratase/2-oxohepta-3-ene-1,7-dioic acid hydratase in catechol pathway